MVAAVNCYGRRNGGGEKPKESELVAQVFFEILCGLVKTEEEEGNHPIINLGGVFSGVAGVVGLGKEEKLGRKTGEVIFGEGLGPGERFVVVEFGGK